MGLTPADCTVKKTLLGLHLLAGFILLPLSAIAEHRLAYEYGDADEHESVYRRYGGSRRTSQVDKNVDTNSCIEGSVIGGLLGAGLGAALSRGNGRWIGVPVGGAAGALVGCQVDGG